VALTAGTRLGPYEIGAQIGVGGMGEVYRARDTNLGRDVAIKVLPDAFARDRERVARFEREAKTLASLNHPNIAIIHGLEKADGVRALVMELVEGPTLADRIAQGPIPLDETLSIARQIAEVLEAAHEQRIIHRDLKPANIKLRPDGTVKVLDFGLAKAMETPSAIGASQSPTITSPAMMTAVGVLLGTAAYMSPEQARGKPVDKRADIWAFGCVLFEMLRGKRAFAGEDVTDTLAFIITKEPDWNALPIETPPLLRRLLRRCLEKDLRRRLHDIGDARLEIEDAGHEAPGDASSTQQTTLAHRHVEFQRLTDFPGLKESPAVSPDGKMVAFAGLIGGRRQILIRLLAGGAPLQVTLNDTDHEHPRWAPDSSTFICYTPSGRPCEGTIWEISALGGPPRRVASAMGGGDISHDGQRIAMLQSSGESVELVVIARNGSRRERVTTLSPAHIYTSPRWSPDDRSIAIQRLYVTGGFDVGLEIVQVGGGDRREVTRSQWLRGFSWLPDGSGLVYSSSRGSTILYPPVFNVRVVGRDGRGDRQVTFGDLSYVDPDVHQSGKLLASRIRSQSDVWRFPIGGSATENTRDAVRITRQSGQAQTPSISPDGTEVVYLSDNGGHGNLWIARTDGSSVRQVTYERDPDVVIGVPMWSPFGDWIVFIVAPIGASSLWAIRPDGSGLHELVARGRGGACWSGDGRWVYYTSGDGIACIAKVPTEGGTSLVVRSHASMPAVTPDGKTLYYVQRPRSDSLGFVEDLEICSASVDGGPSSGIARVASERVPVGRHLFQPFLSPDGKWLAAPLTDGATSNIWVLPTSGGPMRALTDFGDRPLMIARSVSWSADSRYVYAAVAEIESDVVLWDGLIP
jgi:eukaryotic-like serine/threonine-protein kinase